jgi:hypothetical protein
MNSGKHCEALHLTYRQHRCYSLQPLCHCNYALLEILSETNFLESAARDVTTDCISFLLKQAI